MYMSAAISALNTVVLSCVGIDPPEWFVKFFFVALVLVAPLTLFRIVRGDVL